MTAIEPDRNFVLKDGYRYFIVALALLCLTSISANVQAFNMAVVCMTKADNNETETSTGPFYDYKDDKLRNLNWAVGIGSAIGTFPFSIAYTRFGAKYIIGIVGMISAALCIVTPLAAAHGEYWFYAVRVLHGLAYSADFAAIGLLCTKWAPLAQSAFYVSTLTSYSSLSSLLMFVFGGYMCETSIGWPLIYYTCAAAGFLFFILWFIFFDDLPSESRFTSAKEVELIQEGKGDEEIHQVKKVPYLQIMTNPVCWTIWYNSFAEIATSFFLYSFVAKFHHNVLGFSIHTAGLMAALPSCIYIPLRIVVGYINDRITFVQPRMKLIVFNSIALVLPAFVYVVVGFIGPELRVLSVVCFVTIYIFYAFSGGGFYKCATLATRQYSHFVIANIQFIKCITLFAGPALFKEAVHDESQLSEWRVAFLVIAGVLLTAGVLFNIMATDKPQKFTGVDKLQDKGNKH
ncbi:unnamed protein product [Bursaphelenchus okinawaensis]|uniref:Major facilitator superfamily (MFS) profile domain-containing protein n=1 Tax=Bursaphelenchus okinawaensis TaxID=465554 RepID=A0A811L168_9BILA|nr:unnamed protein product [Bursaphelenchus okinawaensis]CAG9114237.1 unnamed protein product [Bursaphelenchus okinawaensis]